MLYTRLRSKALGLVEILFIYYFSQALRCKGNQYLFIFFHSVQSGFTSYKVRLISQLSNVWWYVYVMLRARCNETGLKVKPATTLNIFNIYLQNKNKQTKKQQQKKKKNEKLKNNKVLDKENII